MPSQLAKDGLITRKNALSWSTSPQNGQRPMAMGAQEIDTQQAAAPNMFAAVVSRDADGKAEQEVIPSGSPATLVLLSHAGSDTGWNLGVASVTVDGNAYLGRNGGGDSAAQLGTFLGGVRGALYETGNPPV